MSWWTLEMFTIEPCFCSARKCLIDSRAAMKEPRRLTASTVSKSLLESSTLGREIWIPALLTSTSTPPSCSTASPTMRTTSSSWETSAPDEHVAHALALHLGHAGLDLLRGAGRLLGLAEVVDGHVGAVLGEAHRDRLADPRAAAGDQHVLALQAGQAGGPPFAHCLFHGAVVRRRPGALHRSALRAPPRSARTSPRPWRRRPTGSRRMPFRARSPPPCAAWRSPRARRSR